MEIEDLLCLSPETSVRKENYRYSDEAIVLSSCCWTLGVMWGALPGKRGVLLNVSDQCGYSEILGNDTMRGTK